jgi:formamidopyrimidine-DNA glycosylase
VPAELGIFWNRQMTIRTVLIDDGVIGGLRNCYHSESAYLNFKPNAGNGNKIKIKRITHDHLTIV